MTESSQLVRFCLLLRLGWLGGEALLAIKAAEDRPRLPKAAEGCRKALVVMFVLFSVMAMVFVGRIASLSFLSCFQLLLWFLPVGSLRPWGGLVFAECLLQIA